MLFIIPLVILVVGYVLGLWCSANGNPLVRRFFFLPILASLAVTLFITSKYERARITPLPGQTLPVLPDHPWHYVPLYALRIAPIALGACLIINAAASFILVVVRRRFRRSGAPVVTDG